MAVLVLLAASTPVARAAPGVGTDPAFDAFVDGLMQEGADDIAARMRMSEREAP